MIGMVLAVAVTAGASFSAAGSGALQQAVRTMGFGRDTEIQAEQRKQATSIAELERIISRMDNEIGGLTTRMADAETAGERIARLDGELAAVTVEMKEMRQRSEAAAAEAWRKPVDHLNTAVTGTRSDIISLRSSLDASDQQRRGELGALAKRLDRLEQTLARDNTASIPKGTSARSGEAGTTDVLGLLGLRGSSASGEARTGHVIDMGTASH
jgi:chromosome segregation ATPase